MKGVTLSVPSSPLLFSNDDLRRLIWPLIIEQLLNITLGIADIVMVASLGEAAVSGVSLVDSINVLLTQVFAALGTGGAVVAAQYIGRRDGANAAKTAKQLIYTVTFFSIILMAAGLIMHKGLLRLVFGNIEDDVMAASQKYFIITLFALPGIAIYNACAALFRAQGNSRISMLIALLVNILNIGGNAFFVFGMHWGVEGVAFPTFVSRTVAAAVLMILLYKGRDYNGKPAISVKGITHFELDMGLVKKILTIGIPNGLENGMFQIGKILVLSLIATYGTAAIAANAAGNTIASFEVLPGSAMGLAMLTVVGQCMGAGLPEQAEYYTKKLMVIAYTAMFALNVPLLLLSHAVISCYHMSPETTRLGWYMALNHGICGILIWPLSFTLPNALRAANDAAFTMIVSLVSMWTVRIGMSYVFKATDIFGLEQLLGWPASFGAMGVWFAMVMDWILRSGLFIWRFKRGAWKNRTLI